MKMILMTAILALAPAAYANDAVNDGGILIDDDAALMLEDDAGILMEEGSSALTEQDATTPFDEEMQRRRPGDRRASAVRCVTGARRSFGQGHAVARNYQNACNRAAREAFYRCSGQFYQGPFPACQGRGWDRGFDRRFPDAGRYRACMNMRCNAVRR